MLKLPLIASILSIAILTASLTAAPKTFTQEEYEEDFDDLWHTINRDYAYFDQKLTEWNHVLQIYRPRIRSVKSTGEFVSLLEAVLEELYDSHAHLNTNTESSPRLVPSGADIWAEWVEGKPLVIEVRQGSAAERAGLRAGMEIVSINGAPVGAAVSERVGKSLRAKNVEAMGWALRMLLAGRRNETRSVEVVRDGRSRTIAIDDRTVLPSPVATRLLDYRRITPDVGYIRINNSLGDLKSIAEFDLALDALRKTRGLILDLRDTPSGGNTTVARGIMGRFIAHDMPYQKHSIPSEERLYGTKRSWIELVSPRGGFMYAAPVVVLVNHWTGSMGEGIAIGMDGMKRATVVGTEMARLTGATSGGGLPNTGIGVTFPTEKLFHVDGTPRERFTPPVLVDVSASVVRGEDLIMDRGLKVLLENIEPASEP